VILVEGPWALSVSPERGGRITSLRLADEELLDQGIGVDDPGAEGFVEGGAWGWDEMVPTIEKGLYPGPGEWAGRELPDHGEAWRLPWSVLDETEASAEMECVGLELPWRLQRRIVLGERAVRVDYAYRNLGRHPLYAYWSAHPLWRYEPGMTIEGFESMSRLPAGTSTKVHLPTGSIDHLRLAWRSRSAVEVAWDPSLTPYVAIWACNGDLGGYRQIAIEPATGGNDRPDPGAPPPLLRPGEVLRWWLEIRDRRA
jgi:galactose mutarotase-like enzyme